MNEPNLKDANDENKDVTRLLKAPPAERDQLYELVYEQLKSIARNRLLA